MEKLEKLILTIMKEAEEDGEPVTREEAEEMAKMELGAKELKNYVATEKTKERKPREKKIDTNKVFLIELLEEACSNSARIDNLKIKNAEREITFTLDDENYSVTLTKHRK